MFAASHEGYPQSSDCMARWMYNVSAVNLPSQCLILRTAPEPNPVPQVHEFHSSRKSENFAHDLVENITNVWIRLGVIFGKTCRTRIENFVTLLFYTIWISEGEE